MVIIREIKRAINIIDLILAPLQMMIIGPRATLGRLLIMVR
jgi:hypothetical protein